MFLRQLTLLIALGIIFAAGVFLHPQFLTVDNQRDVLEFVAINGILAVGMTLVILTAGIDLSVGSVLSLCTVVCAMLIMPPDFDADGALGGTFTRAHLILLPALAIFGGLIAWLIVSPMVRALGRRPRLTPLGVTVAVGVSVIVACLVVQVARGYLTDGFTTLGVALVVPPVGGLLGMASGLIIARTRLQPFIVTLAMMILAVGLAKWIAGDGGRIHTIYTAYENEQTREVEVAGAPPSFERLGNLKLLEVGTVTQRSGNVRSVKLIPLPGLIFIGCWLLVAFLLHKLPLGRHIYAVGGNEEAARLSGIRTAQIKVFVYTASGMLAGVAAVLYCAKYMQGKADAGQMMELDAIAAVVIGGTSLMGGRGSIFGTLVGVMIFGYLTNILNLRSVSSEIQEILKGIIIVGAAAIQTGGLGGLMTSMRRTVRLGT